MCYGKVRGTGYPNVYSYTTLFAVSHLHLVSLNEDNGKETKQDIYLYKTKKNVAGHKNCCKGCAAESTGGLREAAGCLSGRADGRNDSVGWARSIL